MCLARSELSDGSANLKHINYLLLMSLTAKPTRYLQAVHELKKGFL